MTRTFVPFRPRLEGSFEERFYKAAEEVAEAQKDLGEAERLIDIEVSWAETISVNPLQRRRYRAVWMLMRDLIRAGWISQWKNGTLGVARPDLTSPITGQGAYKAIQERKQDVRSSMQDSRLSKIYEARDFIERMEKPPAGGIAKVPVTRLIADGAELAAQLKEVANLPRAERPDPLGELIQPYLQLIEDSVRCTQSEHKLSDIWRYFRFTWQTPAENTPGRTMRYLIRDGARPYHPVMGIISLENAPLRIAVRDHHLGWSRKVFSEDVNKGTITERREHFERLLRLIDEAIEEIYIDDLCSPSELTAPTPATFHRLISIADEAAREREDALQRWQAQLGGDGKSAEDAERSDLGNVSLEVENALYRRKRAMRLNQLLQAHYHVNRLLEHPNFETRWRPFLESEDGRSAVWAALLTLKNRHVGTSMLELNVCGAIPPYNEVLGGKLAALLAISPRVIADYEKRYGDRASDIASRMKGEQVVRPAHLIYIGTTSLYTTGVAQYNRLKLPAGLLRDDTPEVRWKPLPSLENPSEHGVTSGYGTLHISRTTLQALEEASNEDDIVRVTHVFGEGQSPKLRIIRRALDRLFVPGTRQDTDELARHEMSRLIYGTWVATNGYEVFRGEAKEPTYYFDTNGDPVVQTQAIVDYWRRRWLASRVDYAPALERMAAFEPRSLEISAMLGDSDRDEFQPIEQKATPMDSPQQVWMQFVRELYRGTSSYADHQDVTILKRAHVSTRLDDAVKQAVRAKRTVVLTGSPGDGKTHLLRILADELERVGASVELDASAVTNHQLRVRWAEALNAGTPYCVAINEAVLKELSDEPAPAKKERWGTASTDATRRAHDQMVDAQRQVEEAVIYEDLSENVSPADSNVDVAVYDLSRRNVLAESVVTRTLDALTDPSLLNTLPDELSGQMEIQRTLNLLREPRVRERFQAILNRVVLRGYHATVRELQALVSYLLFGGLSLEQLILSSGNAAIALPQLLFDGEGTLFDQIRSTFDPAQISHPVWDEHLAFAETDPEDWLDAWGDEKGAFGLSQMGASLVRFKARKRAFYLFHTDGAALLSTGGGDETAFGDLLSRTNQRRTLREIVKLLNGFFGDDAASGTLRVWHSHRYDQSARLVLYSSHAWPAQAFEVVWPKLRSPMSEAFDLAKNHLLLRLRDRPRARLRIDFSLFQLLQRSRRGMPVLTIEDDITRRIWQFMEKLAPLAKKAEEAFEYRIVVLDAKSGQQAEITVDAVDPAYLSFHSIS